MRSPPVQPLGSMNGLMKGSLKGGVSINGVPNGNPLLGKRQKMNQSNNHDMNGLAQSMSNGKNSRTRITTVDQETLKARLYFPAEKRQTMAEVNPNPLVFKGPTASQQRKAAEPIRPRLEPLPGLAKAQERNKPEYIQKMERERLIQEGILKPEAADGSGPASKRRRPSHPDRLDRAASTASLPDIPNDFRNKQESLGLKSSP
jgi:hypothetical protein